MTVSRGVGRGRRVGFRINICPAGHDKRVVGRKYDGSCVLCINTRQNDFARKNPVVAKIRSYRAHAKERKLSFELTESQFESLVTSPCRYCGGFALNLNGVDRVDSNLGYTPENSVPCCKWCNLAKSDRSIEDFSGWILRAADHLRSTIKGG